MLALPAVPASSVGVCLVVLACVCVCELLVSVDLLFLHLLGLLCLVVSSLLAGLTLLASAVVVFLSVLACW